MKRIKVKGGISQHITRKQSREEYLAGVNHSLRRTPPRSSTNWKLTRVNDPQRKPLLATKNSAEHRKRISLGLKKYWKSSASGRRKTN